MKWKTFTTDLLADEGGQDLVEYALIGVFIGFACVALVKGLTTNLGTVFSAVGTTLTTAT